MAELAKRYPRRLAGRLHRTARRRLGGGRRLPQPGRSPVDSARAGSARSRASCSGPAEWRCWPGSTDAEFIWCGNIKPAAYPAKWTMERTGTPFGILLHGGDLLILQHQIHQSAIKRKTAAALLALGRGARRQQRVDPRSLPHPAERARDRRAARPGTRRAARRRPRRSSGPASTRARFASATGWTTVAGCSRSRDSRGTRASTPALQALARLRVRAIPISGTRWSAPARSRRRSRPRRASSAWRDRVRFLTDVPDRDLPALYNTAEIYLGVSRLMEQRVEGFGISLAEASACGVPVIAGRSGGIPAAVRDGETGLLVDAERAEAVARGARPACSTTPRSGRGSARPGAARSRATTTGIASPAISCASAASWAPPPSRPPADALGARAFAAVEEYDRQYQVWVGAAGAARPRSRLAAHPSPLAPSRAAPPLLARRQAGARFRLHGRHLHAQAPAAGRRGGGLRHLARRPSRRPSDSAAPRRVRCSPRCRRGPASSTGSTATRCSSTSRTTRA